MKKTISTIALFFICFCAKSQITLDYTYSYVSTTSGQVILFSSNGEKIMMNDTGVSQVSLYNTDYSLWKTINLPTYTGFKFSGAYAVSDNLFNSDDLVELIAIYYSTSVSSTYKAQVINESGTVLQDLGNAYSVEVHIINGNYKLFAYQLNIAAGSAESFTFNIYSLPGTQPCGQCGSLGLARVQDIVDNGSSNLSAPIPNPNAGQSKINYTLPEGINQGVITIFNSTGQSVKTYNVGSNFQFITLDNSNLPSGVYYYNLTGAGIQPTGNKMVIVK
jgi:Secretion system C-terminal sorting domain